MVVETTTRIFDQVVAKPGETILVSGASGGVGTVLIQFARHRGMTVIGTASDRNQDYVRKLGAIPTPYGPGLADRVAQLAPQGVDAAFDIAGSGIIAELVDIVGNPVRVLSISDFSAPNYGAQFSPDPRQSPGRHLAEAARLHSEGGLRLTVEKTFPLARIGEAQALSSEGHVTGKDPFEIFEKLSVKDPSHAFYLGYEMAKAVTALTLKKNYVQDEALNWGFLTRPEKSHLDRREELPEK